MKDGEYFYSTRTRRAVGEQNPDLENCGTENFNEKLRMRTQNRGKGGLRVNAQDMRYRRAPDSQYKKKTTTSERNS